MHTTRLAHCARTGLVAALATVSAGALHANLNVNPGPDIHYSSLFVGPEYLSDPRFQVASQGVELGTAPWAHSVTAETELPQLMREIDAFGAAGIKLHAELGSELSASTATAACGAGVRIATGSDHPGDGRLPGVHLEYALLLERAGFEPLEVLESATRIGAEAIGIQTTRGTLEVGKQATLLILAEDPSWSVEPLTEPLYVIKRGVLSSGATLRAATAPIDVLNSIPSRR